MNGIFEISAKKLSKITSIGNQQRTRNFLLLTSVMFEKYRGNDQKFIYIIDEMHRGNVEQNRPHFQRKPWSNLTGGLAPRARRRVFSRVNKLFQTFGFLEQFSGAYRL